MTTQHSILAPSSAARRMACPGSRALEEFYPQEDTPESREGHAAHEVAKAVLVDMSSRGAYSDFAEPLKAGSQTASGEMITDEMMKGADSYARDIYGILGSRNILDSGLEAPVNIKNIHPDCWGTPDYWALTPRHLYIWDYKFGHKYVDVFENWQLIAYASGILAKLTSEGKYDEHMAVTFRIVQPRSYGPEGTIREWSLMATELRPYFNQLEMSEHKAMMPEVPCTPNPECNNCSGRHACAALRDAVLTRIDTARASIPSELSAEQAGNLLRQIQYAQKLLGALETGLSTQVTAHLSNGESVPNFRLDSARGRDFWTAPAEEVAALGELFGVDISKPLELLTPKQAITAGLPEAAIEGLYANKSTLKLVQVKENEARKVFK